MDARRFRIPVAAILCLTVPPFAPLAWIALSGPERSMYLRSNLVRAGFAVVAMSVLPLLFVLVADTLGLWPDPDPNPIGVGLLFFAGGILGAILVTIGIMSVNRRS